MQSIKNISDSLDSSKTLLHSDSTDNNNTEDNTTEDKKRDKGHTWQQKENVL
jgi:hypothetical protein